ncbi:hypothetical protein T310_5519 [Rasamsonia emersonii CBS 393.64]|uniref:Uncharacterized protein n=1 Tax=Rasamsonia emersonii (strain ATCC 16479 / CBS 393.64 / IMI 116815) TaxID=1408163 RepID=A0A0F4YS63_RASE3|nr:hypothetical protein T310_5519 [Rasamsonia emersonii CBS 393.64]KKA20468.1 hypothetical protein T310_5519 [Rasamsonia emersonii CBS 393.64]
MPCHLHEACQACMVVAIGLACLANVSLRAFISITVVLREARDYIDNRNNARSADGISSILVFDKVRAGPQTGPLPSMVAETGPQRTCDISTMKHLVTWKSENPLHAVPGPHKLLKRFIALLTRSWARFYMDRTIRTATNYPRAPQFILVECAVKNPAQWGCDYSASGASGPECQPPTGHMSIAQPVMCGRCSSRRSPSANRMPTGSNPTLVRPLSLS